LILAKCIAKKKSKPHKQSLLLLSENEADTNIKTNLFMAILFLVFEVIILLLFLWAMILKKMGQYEFFSMIFFLSIIMIAFVYTWKKGISK
jgi:NADH:ubiquinone oxidoreductase subunit 3 (subunit A)